MMNAGEFKKGRTKTGGRTKGSKNKATAAIKDRIKEYIDNNFDSIVDDMQNLEPQERIRTFVKLLEFVLPKQKAIDLDIPQKNNLLQIAFTKTNVNPITNEAQINEDDY